MGEMGDHRRGPATSWRDAAPRAVADATETSAPDSGPAQGWEALFWLVFNRSSNPIALLDEQQRVLEVNEPAVAVIQRGRGELLGRSLVDSFVATDRRTAARDWAGLLQAGDGAGIRMLLRPDGTTVELDWAARVASIDGRRVVIAVMLDVTPLPRLGDGRRPMKPLTPREREVVTLIALGHETGAIASLLVISPETVKSHVRSAMSKLRAHTRAQLVAVALGSGQIAPVAPLGR